MTFSIMQKARAQMCVKHTFWGTLLMTTQMVEDRSCPTAWCDGMKVGYNPDFVEKLPIDVVKFVLAHEIGHKFLLHILRKQNREMDLWNKACDYVLNLMLQESGFQVWEHALLDSRFKGMSPEQVYDLLKQEQDKQPQQGQGQGKGRPDQQGGLTGDMRPCPIAGDPAQVAAASQAIRGQVAQAAAIARAAGRMPAGLARMIEELLEPPQPWEALFAEYMTRVVHDDETWSRRNRRFNDIYLPARHELRMGEVVIVGDTSGSMCNPKVFGMVANEINAMIEFCKPERVRVIWADDTDCELEEVFEPGEEVHLNPKGGGGTDMRKPLKYVEQFDPAVVVLVTDGETPWLESVPYPLITLCTTGKEVPLGDVIRVSIG